MDVKVEVAPMTAGSSVIEPILLIVVANHKNTSIKSIDGNLSFTIPSIGGHSISGINPPFTKVGVKAAA